MDYMYMESEQVEERGMPILVLKDEESGWTSSRVVPKRGKHAYAIKSVCKDIEWMG